jgi:hypothetical protein
LRESIELTYFVADGSGNQMTLLLHWDGGAWSIAGNLQDYGSGGAGPHAHLSRGAKNAPRREAILQSIYSAVTSSRKLH